MNWLLFEYLLKGLFLGLLAFVAIATPDGAALARSFAIITVGLICGMAVAWVRTRRRGIRPRGRPLAEILFVLLDNPWEIYAGVTFGLAVAAIALRSDAINPWLLPAATGIGCVVGIGLAGLRLVQPARVRWSAAFAGAAALTTGGIAAIQFWPELVPAADHRIVGLTLLLGLPYFALLTFVGVAEESEVEVAAACAALAVGVWLVQLTPSLPLLALVLPAALYWLYTRRMQIGLQTFKHTLRGITMARVGCLPAALVSLHRALRLDPDSRLARAALWDVHRDLDPATIAQQPDLLQLIDPQVCLDRAAGLLLAGPPAARKVTEAVHLLDLVDRREPALRPRTLYWRTVAALHSRNPSAAAECLSELIDSDRWTTGNAERESALFAAWRLALVLHPEMARLVGEPQLRQPGRRLQAIAAAERELAAVPDDAGAWTLKRVLYSGLTQQDFSAGPVAELDFGYAQQLGLALIDDPSRWRRGVEYLQIAAAGLPQQGPSLFLQIAETCERHGDEAGARAAYEAAKRSGLALGPQALPDAERHAYFAVVKRLAEDGVAREDLDAAATHYQLYTAYDRAGVETFRTLADLHERRGDPLAVVRAIEQAMIFAPKDADLRDRRDRGYFSLNPDMLPSESARAGLDFGYCLSKSRSLLAHRDADLEVIDWARHLAGLAMVLNPDSIAAKVLWAQATLRRGERDEAVRVLTAVTATKPERFATGDDEDAWYLACRLLGDLCLRELDQPERAIECYTAYRASPKSGADTLFKLGEAHEQVGDPARAARFYEQVTAYDGHPLGGEAQDALRRLRSVSR